MSDVLISVVIGTAFAQMVPIGSADGGSSWQPIFEGTYVPIDPSPPSRN